MGKRLILVLALALVVGLTFSAAYAEVQNVKVSGDINILGVMRNNFDLGDPTGTATKEDDNGSFFATQTRVRIDADLTDNVMATVRLINERNWTNETNSSTDIDLDLAYVTLKEFLYSPLTLTLGRQELRFGNQLIIGNNGTYVTTAGTSVINGLPSDLSERNSFDALRATLNYDPLVIDLVYAKVSNNNANASDDTDLFGVNASYDLSKKINIQGYIWDRKDKSTATTVSMKKDDTYTLGGLLTISPIADLKTSLEGAWQFGRNRNPIAGQTDRRNAFAIQARADYAFSKVKFVPAIGGGYTYLSGDGKQAAWNQMYYNQNLGNIAYAILPFSNMHVFNLKGSVKPMEDVTLSVLYGYYRLANSVGTITSGKVDGNGNAYLSGTVLAANKNNLGQEVDVTVAYDYTEDVQLGLTLGCFAPGDAFHDNRLANQAVASMKVTF